MDELQLHYMNYKRSVSAVRLLEKKHAIVIFPMIFLTATTSIISGTLFIFFRNFEYFEPKYYYIFFIISMILFYSTYFTMQTLKNEKTINLARSLRKIDGFEDIKRLNDAKSKILCNTLNLNSRYELTQALERAEKIYESWTKRRLAPNFSIFNFMSEQKSYILIAATYIAGLYSKDISIQLLSYINEKPYDFTISLFATILIIPVFKFFAKWLLVTLSRFFNNEIDPINVENIIKLMATSAPINKNEKNHPKKKFRRFLG